MEIENFLEIKQKLESFEKMRISQRLANKNYYDKNKDKKKLTRKPVQLTEEQRIKMREKAKNYLKHKYDTDHEYREAKKLKNKEHQRLKKQISTIEIFEN